MSSTKILVTGSNGQLGKSIESVAALYPGYEFLFATRETLPIDNADAVASVFASFKPDYVVNAAAYTAVDKAESDKTGADTINASAVGILAGASKELGAKFIHISTDYVFNGKSERPYTEEDDTDPVNHYGASKLAGEILAREKNPDSIVIRTAWVYSEFGNNFVKTMMRLMKDRKEIGVVYDQVGAPTYAPDLATTILEVIKAPTWVPGVYHYSNRGKISWFDFAQAIKMRIESSCNVKAITTAEFPTPAKRPSFSLLDTGKIRETYSLQIPQWEESLDICFKKL
jgi:dTDP-4-dehydrorhamnose reductase